MDRRSYESLHDRLVHFYGGSDTDLERAIRLRQRYESVLFSLAPQQLSDSVDLPTSTPPINATFLAKVRPTILEEGFDVVVDDHRLKPDELRDSVVSTILNVGHPVISIDWSLKGLACSVLDGIDPSKCDTNADLSRVPGRIVVYDVHEGTPKKRAAFRFPVACTSIAWRPSSEELLVCCADGKTGVVSTNYVSGTVELTPIGFPDWRATACCWRTPNTFVVGYDNGNIAEFNATEPTRPQYTAEAHSSAITTVCSGRPLLEQKVLTMGVDGYTRVHDVHDLRAGTALTAPRLRFCGMTTCYVPLADSFLGFDDIETSRLIPARNTSEIGGCAITRHSGCFVTASCASDVHPLVVTGAQDGSVHIANALGRTMVTSRKNKETHAQCAVWRLEYSAKQKRLRFVELLQVDTLRARKQPKELPVYPVPVTITSCAWQPSSTWFASSSAAGLIRFDNVDA